MVQPDAIRNRSLAIIATLLVVAGLRASYPVTMPIVVALVIIAAAWPIKPWLDRLLPSSLSYVGTVLALAFVFAGFMAAVYFSIAQVIQAFAQNQEEFGRIYGSATQWAERWGVHLGGQQGYARLIGFAQSLFTNTYTIIIYVGFIAILVILGLPEVPALRRKAIDEFSTSDKRELLATAGAIAEKVRQYLGVTVLTSLLTGIGSAVLAWLIGLDLALVWGVLNFVLNFVPVVGNIVGIVPPTLYAVVQFNDVTWPTVVFVAFTMLQIAISNFVYPMLQGRSLSLSPVAIVIALSFWSWVWGIAGALIAIPVTVAVVIVFEHFSSTAWIARLLSTPR